MSSAMKNVSYLVLLALASTAACDNAPTAEPVAAPSEPPTEIAPPSAGERGPEPVLRTWLQPADGMTDVDPNGISVAVEWHAQPTREEIAALTAARVFDSTGRLVETTTRPDGDFETLDGQALLQVHFVTPPPNGWYTLAVAPKGRFRADARWGSASVEGVQFARFRVGSAPRVSAARFCAGRGAAELYVDFSERVSASAALRGTALEGTGFECERGTVEVEGESAVAVRFACSAVARDAQLAIVAEDTLWGMSGAPVVDAAGAASATRSVLGSFDLARLAALPTTGCSSLPAEVPAGLAYGPSAGDFAQ